MNGQRSIPFGRPWITEEDRKAVLAVLEGPQLTHGPHGQGFENEFAEFLGDGARCVAVSSGMAALHLAYLQFGIDSGDEVIVPAQTHTATVHAVEWVGAKPVFVDCDRATGNLTAEGIRAAITPRTKAISVVHFLGIPCSMPEIMVLAEQHGLKVIEDCAIALGARYNGTHVGLFGDAGCFSFYPVKHITTGEGGMFVSRHRDVATAVAKLRAFGVDRDHTERTIPGIYDVPTLGLNYRMSEMQATLGRRQLGRIRENLEWRGANFKRLKSHLVTLADVSVLDSSDESAANSHYCLSAVLNGKLREQRDEIVKRLQQAGVGTSVYYPHPVPRMTYYRKKYGFQAENCPHAVAISDRSVALPVGPHLSPSDIEYVAENFERCVKEIKL